MASLRHLSLSPTMRDGAGGLPRSAALASVLLTLARADLENRVLPRRGAVYGANIRGPRDSLADDGSP